MTPISNIYPNSEIQKLSGAASKRRAQFQRPSMGSDGLFISEEAKKLQSQQGAIKKAEEVIEKVPLIREDLVAQLKEKLANGEYIHLTEEMAGVIAERIISGLYLA